MSVNEQCHETSIVNIFMTYPKDFVDMHTKSLVPLSPPAPSLTNTNNSSFKGSVCPLFQKSSLTPLSTTLYSPLSVSNGLLPSDRANRAFFTVGFILTSLPQGKVNIMTDCEHSLVIISCLLSTTPLVKYLLYRKF